MNWDDIYTKEEDFGDDESQLKAWSRWPMSVRSTFFVQMARWKERPIRVEMEGSDFRRWFDEDSTIMEDVFRSLLFCKVKEIKIRDLEVFDEDGLIQDLLSCEQQALLT
jgi:hypothetical protein